MVGKCNARELFETYLFVRLSVCLFSVVCYCCCCCFAFACLFAFFFLLFALPWDFTFQMAIPTIGLNLLFLFRVDWWNVQDMFCYCGLMKKQTNKNKKREQKKTQTFRFPCLSVPNFIIAIETLLYRKSAFTRLICKARHASIQIAVWVYFCYGLRGKHSTVIRPRCDNILRWRKKLIFIYHVYAKGDCAKCDMHTGAKSYFSSFVFNLHWIRNTFFIH